MGKLNDVNTTDMLDAIRLGCRAMSNLFNADDDDIPFFDIVVRPHVKMSFSWAHSEAQVPGRFLNAMLSAENAAGVELDEEAVQKIARAAFFSFEGPVVLPLNRNESGGPLVNFLPHQIREGLHALYALVRYRQSSRAQELAEANIDAIREHWHLSTGWDYQWLERKYGLKCDIPSSFMNELGRAIGPLVKYYRATGYHPALDLAMEIKEKALNEFLTKDGEYHEVFGYHCHSTTSTMSSLAQLADLTHDAVLLNRVKAFYDYGLWKIRDELGWCIETTRKEGGSFRNGNSNYGRGEVNSTGDILETALILGRWGYTQCFHDAERMLRCHLLPSQLRDVSFIDAPANPEGDDGKHDVADRLRGSFGFPAPYGHEPVNISMVKFNTDIVGGSVASLCEAYRERTRSDAAGHWVNLLFDQETPQIKVESAYTHDALRIWPKESRPLFVRMPPWCNPNSIQVEGVPGTGGTVVGTSDHGQDAHATPGMPRLSNGYLLFTGAIANRPITIRYPLKQQQITLKNPAGPIRVRLKGDMVEAMDNHGADLTFFDTID